MKNKTKFGIISGAGPMAGALLYQRVIELLQAKGAWRDADFPEIFIYNVPFSDMLLNKKTDAQIKKELITALELISNYVDQIYIACQTLHIFLTPDEIIRYNVVNIISLINPMNHDLIYVVASNTSREFNLHEKMLQKKCHYLEPEKSDMTIENILKGNFSTLAWLEDLAKNYNIILGCTEFSVAAKYMHAKFIDPIELAAEEMARTFSQS